MTRRRFERFGRYAVLERLGRGGMGHVDLAVTLDPGGCVRLAVLKRLRADRRHDADVRRMFHDEARAALRLGHPNLIAVFGVEQTDEELAMVMELLEGASLADLAKDAIARDERLPIGIAIAAVRDALAGLAYAHDLADYDGRPLGLVHRDATPHNVIVTFGGCAKVLDFGIAKIEGAINRTATGMVKGKLGYLAPEQIALGPFDRRVDVFAMGVTLWELLAGIKRPGCSSMLEAFATALAPIPDLREAAPWVDPALAAIVASAAAIEPDARWASARDMAAALDDYARGARLATDRDDVARFVEQAFGHVRDARARRLRELLPLAIADLAHDDDGPTDAAPIPESAASDSPVVHESAPPTITGPTRVARTSRATTALALGLAGIGVTAFVAALNESPSAVRAAGGAHATSAAHGKHESVTGTERVIAPTAPTAPDAPRARSVALHPPPPRHVDPPPPEPPAAIGWLTLDTYPWTDVQIDGRAYGATPLLRVPLAAGQHSVVVRNPDRDLVTTTPIEIRAGEVLARRLALE